MKQIDARLDIAHLKGVTVMAGSGTVSNRCCMKV